MTEGEWENRKTGFRNWYSENKASMELTQKKYESLITELLVDNDEFSNPEFESRTKTCESCIGKFERRKINDKKADEITVEKLKSEITDLIGIRVICSYEDEIPKIQKIIENDFEIIKKEDKSDELKKNEKFGYKSVHLDVRLTKKRLEFKEYEKVSIFPVEIQIRTIIQHAWSSLEHKIIYKHNVPDKLLREVERLAALFEIADSEFMRVRDARKQQIDSTEKETRGEEPEKICMFQLKKKPVMKNPKKGLDASTFMDFLISKSPEYIFTWYKVNIILNEIFLVNENFDVKTLEVSYENYHSVVEKFKAQNSLSDMKPYTELRHILYMSDKEKYAPLLTELQRNNFDKFLSEQN